MVPVELARSGERWQSNPRKSQKATATQRHSDVSMQPVRVKCPLCGQVTQYKNLQELRNQVEDWWGPWQPYLTAEQKRKLSEHNSPQEWRKMLHERGELIMFCDVCRLIETVRLELKIANERDKTYPGVGG